jgi:regulator of replication initiation timing
MAEIRLALRSELVQNLESVLREIERLRAQNAALTERTQSLQQEIDRLRQQLADQIAVSTAWERRARNAELELYRIKNDPPQPLTS